MPKLEEKEAEKHWKQLDPDNNGYLEGPEILALVRWSWESCNPGRKFHVVSPEGQASEREKLMERLDTSRDGRLDKTEFFQTFGLVYIEHQATFLHISHAIFIYIYTFPASRPFRTPLISSHRMSIRAAGRRSRN